MIVKAFLVQGYAPEGTLRQGYSCKRLKKIPSILFSGAVLQCAETSAQGIQSCLHTIG